MITLEEIDQGAVFAFSRQIRRPALTPAMEWLTHLGDWRFLAFVVAAACCVFILVGQRRAGALVLLSLALSLLLTETVKPLVRRERPNEPGIDNVPSSFSFPSGHALEATAVYVTLGLLLARRRVGPRRGDLYLTLALLLSLLVAFTRLYLCVHYVADVLAGLVAGLAVACLLRWLDGRLSPPGALAPD
jgi:undecaprenyl-diphosphatase